MKRAMIVRKTSCLRFVAMSLVMLSVSCQQSPEEKLIGRWYNNDMSLRFRDDGGAVFNSVRGLGIGRYVFESTPTSVNIAELEPNTTIDLVRNNARVQLKFHIEFLGPNRLRVTDLTEREPDSGPSVMPTFSILKRAEGDTMAATR